MAVSRKASLDCLLTPPLFSVDSNNGRIESDTEWRSVPGPTRPITVDPGPFAAVDFETYYARKYGLTEMSPWEYVAHAQFNAYLVALEMYDGRRWWRWVGHPDDAPWSSLPPHWVSHSAAFDELVARRLQADGRFPRGLIPELWDCTQDLAGWFQLDRALEACAPVLIGETVDKSVRKAAKSGGASAVALRDYAGTDGRQCAWIFATKHHEWPEQERFLSRLQRRAGYAGVFADQEMMVKAKVHFTSVMRRIEKELPWTNRYPVASKDGVMIECAKRGIPNVVSFDMDEPATIQWLKTYDKDKWLSKIKTYTKCKQQIAHVEMMQERTRKDGTVPFELGYRLAPHTARWQSAGGLRLQNLDRDEFEGFNPRWYISVPDQWCLLSGDLSQIEPRVLNWLVNDVEFLKAVTSGFSPYDAHAIATMGYVPQLVNGKPQKLKDYNMGLYALAKARLLALGYRAGPPKFCTMARTMAGITVYEDEASYCPNPQDIGSRTAEAEFYRASSIRDRIRRNDLQGWAVFPPAKDAVEDFRAKSRKVVGFWYRTEAEMRACLGGDHFVPMPDGSTLRYFDVSEVAGPYGMELDCWVVRKSRNPHHHKRTHGGVLVENRVQRIARDVLADIKYRIAHIDPKRLKYRWSAHDELNAYAKKADAKFLFDAFMHEMKTAPKWATGLPLGAEGEILDHYKK